MDYSLILTDRSINWCNGNTTVRRKGFRAVRGTNKIIPHRAHCWPNGSQSDTKVGLWGGEPHEKVLFLPLKTASRRYVKVRYQPAYRVWLKKLIKLCLSQSLNRGKTDSNQFRASPSTLLDAWTPPLVKEEREHKRVVCVHVFSRLDPISNKTRTRANENWRSLSKRDIVRISEKNFLQIRPYCSPVIYISCICSLLAFAFLIFQIILL